MVWILTMYVILSADLRDDAVSYLGLVYRSICLGLVYPVGLLSSCQVFRLPVAVSHTQLNTVTLMKAAELILIVG